MNIEFSESAFFYFLLPPIIFAAGYTLKKKNFVRNISYILLLGLLGTIISMVALSMWLLFLNDWLYTEVEDRLYQSEILLLASVLCATDTVAALSIVREKSFPTLNSILFGEGVINDAVAILIFKAVEKMIRSKQTDPEQEIEEVEITIGNVGLTAWSFLYLSVLSVLLGLFFGLLSALISKHTKLDAIKEIFLLIMIAYLSYVVSERFELSAIMSLFVCGVT